MFPIIRRSSSKIEREEAIEFMDSIIEVSDGLLVARGEGLDAL